MLSVTSLFANECLKTSPVSPALYFSLGTSDWTSNVLKYGSVTRRSDKLSAGGVTIALTNTEAEFNNLIDSNFFYDVNRRGTIKVGFSDGSSIDTINLYIGNLIDVDFKDAECELKFLDQWELFDKQTVGDQDTTVYLHDSSSYKVNPADVFATLVSCYAGLDFGTYVNCAAWLSWRNDCGSNWLYIRGSGDGDSIKDLLEEMADKTDTIFATEQGKIYPIRNTIIQSYAIYDESNIFKWELGIDTKRMVNYVETFFRRYRVNTYDNNNMFVVDSESYNAYGKHYKSIERESVFLCYDTRTTGGWNYYPHRIGYNILAKYGRPLKKMKIETGMMGFKQQINDRVNVSLVVASLDNVKFRVEGIGIESDKSKVKLDLLEDRIIKYWSTFDNYDYPIDVSINVEISDSWEAMADASTVDGIVQNANIFSGKEVLLEPESNKDCIIRRYLYETINETPQWIKLKIWAQSTGAIDSPEIAIYNSGLTAKQGFVAFRGSSIYVRDGAVYVSAGAYNIASGDTIKCKLDMDTKTWDFYKNDMSTPNKTGLDFLFSTTNDIAVFEITHLSSLYDAAIDDLFIGLYDPDSGV